MFHKMQRYNPLCSNKASLSCILLIILLLLLIVVVVVFHSFIHMTYILFRSLLPEGFMPFLAGMHIWA